MLEIVNNVNEMNELGSYSFVDAEGSPGFESGCGRDVTYAIGKADKYRM